MVEFVIRTPKGRTRAVHGRIPCEGDTVILDRGSMIVRRILHDFSGARGEQTIYVEVE